jgi:osmotically-inducible protein OsmY
MKNNAELQNDVQNSIKWEPLLHAAEIGVTAKDGVVSLTGVVDSYVKKTEAENAAKKVFGVKALVENIEVKFPSNWSKTDEEVANEALVALMLNYSVPSENLMVKIENGWVTLSGELPWNYQREAAKNAIHYLIGVKGVTNNIIVKSDVHIAIKKENLESAIARNWGIYNSDINVSVNETTVTLTGTVPTWYQKQEVTRTAYNTPGIWHVQNDLKVDSEFVFN